MLRWWIAVNLVAIATTDIYMHNPRGSNDRLSEQNRDRANGNRLFDSQNNNRGGYNVGSLKYCAASELTIEWTAQHSCGSPTANCELIIQMMCGDNVRDGVQTRTIPDRRDQCEDNNCDTDLEYGMHENYAYYQTAKTTNRNTGLFTADQNLREDDTRSTRQNPDGNRNGYECPEERDYYPYWRPTPWMDIAILTNDVTRCALYKEQSENVLGRSYCKYPIEYINYKEATRRERDVEIPITEAECNAVNLGANAQGVAFGDAVWTLAEPHGLPAPDCVENSLSRENHNGNGEDGYMLNYNWTIPRTVISESCVMRLRYNISTGEMNEGGFDSDIDASLNNGGNNNNNAGLDIASVFAETATGATQAEIDAAAALKASLEEDRGYTFEGNPNVQVFAESDVAVQLAINTAQYGRTFQDRSHAFAIRNCEEVEATAKIRNLNVRGKRGNIVQVYPAVEYDYVPTIVSMTSRDYVHWQWTGSDNNPNNNDGQGRQGSDRSNACPCTAKGMKNESMLEEAAGNEKFNKKTNYPEFIEDATEESEGTNFAGLDPEGTKSLCSVERTAFRGKEEELDDAGTHFNAPPMKISTPGIYNYMCTRNNNFSNRSQKGTLKVTYEKSEMKQVTPGTSSAVTVDETDKVKFSADEGAVSRTVQVYVSAESIATAGSLTSNEEEADPVTGREAAPSGTDTETGNETEEDDLMTGEEAETGDPASVLLRVFPDEVKFAPKKAHLETNYKAGAQDSVFVAAISRGGSYASLQESMIEEMSADHVKFFINSGGKFQVMKYPYVPIIIGFCILGVVLLALIIGLVIYFVKNPEAKYRVMRLVGRDV